MYAALHVFMICWCNEKELSKIIPRFLSDLLNSVGIYSISRVVESNLKRILEMTPIVFDILLDIFYQCEQTRINFHQGTQPEIYSYQLFDDSIVNMKREVSE